MSTIRIANAQDLIIDGSDAELVFSPEDRYGIWVTAGSRNVTLKNLSIDYEPLPFTQGVVTAAEPNEIQVRLDPGYPVLDELKYLDRLFLFHSSDGLYKSGRSAAYFKSFRKLHSAREYGIPISSSHRSFIQAGDRVVFPPRRPGAAAVKIDGLASDITLQNVTIYSSPGMALMARFAGQIKFAESRIIPRPRGSGREQERLISSNADGVNVAYGPHGPNVSSSIFRNLGDDAVNLHGIVFALHSTNGTLPIFYRPFRTDRAVIERLATGSEVQFLDASFGVIGQDRISAVHGAEAPANFDWAALETRFPRSHLNGRRQASFYSFEVAGSVPNRTAYVALSSMATNNYAIQDNVFSNIRGHAVVTGASDGKILRNRISELTHNGIVVGPNFEPWREGGWVRNLQVEENVMEAICKDTTTVDGKAWTSAAIAVGARLERQSSSLSHNSNIQVSRNRLGACGERRKEK